jgi:hypothetical protein
MLQSSPLVDKRGPRPPGMNTTLAPADTHPPAAASILSTRYRATTLGMAVLAVGIARRVQAAALR